MAVFLSCSSRSVFFSLRTVSILLASCVQRPTRMSRKLHLAVAYDILLNLWLLGNANILFAHPLRNLLVVLQLHPLEADGIDTSCKLSFSALMHGRLDEASSQNCSLREG